MFFFFVGKPRACQKRLTPFPMILLSKSLKITVETQSYQPRYELFKWPTTTRQMTTTLFYENYNEGCPPGINFGSHSL